jgi:hypothetical protein
MQVKTSMGLSGKSHPIKKRKSTASQLKRINLIVSIIDLLIGYISDC